MNSTREISKTRRE